MHSVDWAPLTTCPKPASASGPAHPSASSPIPETHKNAPLSTCDWPVSVLSLSHSIQKDFLRRRERAHAAGGHVGLLTQSSRPASSTRPRRVLLTRGPTSRNAKASLLPFFFFCKPLAGVPTHLPSLVGCSNVFLTFGSELNSEERQCMSIPRSALS